MWDTDQMFRVATAISDEARAKYNDSIRRGKRNICQGLTFWTPNINHKFSPNANEGVAKAIKAGTDLNCGVEHGNLLSAVRAGSLKASEIDQSLRRLLVARFSSVCSTRPRS